MQKGGTGRDHNPHAFTTWLAGGGVKGGVHYGETDEIGHKAVVDRVSVNDLHATILHLLGIDHERLTYRYNGRDFRLTDVAGNVVKEDPGVRSPRRSWERAASGRSPGEGGISVRLCPFIFAPLTPLTLFATLSHEGRGCFSRRP